MFFIPSMRRRREEEGEEEGEEEDVGGRRGEKERGGEEGREEEGGEVCVVIVQRRVLRRWVVGRRATATGQIIYQIFYCIHLYIGRDARMVSQGILDCKGGSTQGTNGFFCFGTHFNKIYI